MRSVLAGLRTLVLPWGAGPTSPRITLGPDVPAALKAYYVSLGLGVSSCELFYSIGGSNYVYIANVIDTQPNIAIGTVYNGVVRELTSYSYDTTDGINSELLGLTEPVAVSFGNNIRAPSASERFQLGSSIGVDLFGALLVHPATGGAVQIADPTTLSSVETWHALTLGAGWTNYGGTDAITQYRLVPSPANCVQLTIAAFGGTRTDATVIGNLPAGYRPAHAVHHSIATSVIGARSSQLRLAPNGDLSILGIGASGDLTGVVLFPLDA